MDGELCQLSLKKIGLALLNYNQRYGCFPPVFLCDRNGKHVNSWRMFAINSGLGYHIRSSYNLSQPWDGPENVRLKLGEWNVREFQCPSDRSQGPAITDYVAVVGPNTMWPGCKAAKPAVDGSDNDKILVIEVIHSDILWMEPRDLTLEQALDAIQPKKGIGIGSHHSDGIHYVTVGGAVRTLPSNIDRESLRKLLVRDSAECASIRCNGEEGGTIFRQEGGFPQMTSPNVVAYNATRSQPLPALVGDRRRTIRCKVLIPSCRCQL